MTTVDKVVSYINSMDPIGREAIIMELKDLQSMQNLYFENPEEFCKKHSLYELYGMEDKFDDKLKNLIGLKFVPIWQIIYRELFKQETYSSPF